LHDQLVAALSGVIYKAAGADPDRQWERIVPEVQKIHPVLEKLEKIENHKHLLVNLRAIDGIMDELWELRPAFGDPAWSGEIYKALDAVFLLWQGEHYRTETGPDGRFLIPEEILQRGYGNFLSGLRERRPDVALDTLTEAFVRNDLGPRAQRRAPPTPPVEVSHIRRAPVPSAVEPPVEDMTARLRARYPFLEAHLPVLRALADSIVISDGGANADPRAAMDRGLSRFIRQLSNAARPNQPSEAVLRGILEADLADELRERYKEFRENPQRAELVAAQAQAIYRLWDGNNRTFNGNANDAPLRIPEKFVDQSMKATIGYLHRVDPDLADLIVASFAGNRARRAEALRNSSSPPSRPAVPITERNVFLELQDRFRLFSSDDAMQNKARAIARDIYQTWLKEDPSRDLETSGYGLRGLVPEATLERRLNVLFGLLDKSGQGDLVRRLKKDNRGPRNERGTNFLEFTIEEENARPAA
jgi:hypothetical protein